MKEFGISLQQISIKMDNRLTLRSNLHAAHKIKNTMSKGSSLSVALDQTPLNHGLKLKLRLTWRHSNQLRPPRAFLSSPMIKLITLEPKDLGMEKRLMKFMLNSQPLVSHGEVHGPEPLSWTPKEFKGNTCLLVQHTMVSWTQFHITWPWRQPMIYPRNWKVSKVCQCCSNFPTALNLSHAHTPIKLISEINGSLRKTSQFQLEMASSWLTQLYAIWRN